MSKNPSDSDLLLELYRLAIQIARTPTKAAMHGKGKYSPDQYTERYGSWVNALKEADIPLNEEDRRFEAELIIGKENIEEVENMLDSNDEDALMKGKCLAELMRLRVDLGYTPTLQEMDEFGQYSPSHYSGVFNSWNNALQELDLELNNNRDVSDQELLKELLRLKDELGTKPTTEDMREHGKYSLPMYYDKFDSWSQALQLADHT